MPRNHIRREIGRTHATGNDGKAYMLVEVALTPAASFTVEEPQPAPVEIIRFELADGSIVDAQEGGLFVVRSTGVTLRRR